MRAQSREQIYHENKMFDYKRGISVDGYLSLPFHFLHASGPPIDISASSDPVDTRFS
jgi:hypothetical protein